MLKKYIRAKVNWFSFNLARTCLYTKTPTYTRFAMLTTILQACVCMSTAVFKLHPLKILFK